MNLTGYVDSIWGVVGIGSMVIAALTYLIKSLTVHLLNKDIEKYKLQIQSEANLAIAKYQSELEKNRIRLQISYGGIFEKQADSILNLYRFLDVFDKSIGNAIHPSGDREAAWDEFLQSWRDLVNYLDECSILLPESVDNLFQEFHKEIFHGVAGYRRAENYLTRATITSDQIEGMLNKQSKILVDLDEVPQLKVELKRELRKLIGVVELND